MARYDKDMFIKYLPTKVYKELVDELNKDSNWITLAEHVAEQLDYSCTWIQSLKSSNNDFGTPAERLLFELDIKMCTVEILCVLLEDCGLLRVLSILSLPEPLKIVEHPTEGLQSETLEISFGQHLHLKCKAVGMPPPNYIWYHDNIELQEFNSCELDLLVNNESQAGEYSCKVSQVENDGTVICSLVSHSVILQISPTPVLIEEQPTPLLEVKDGEEFIIKCLASSHPRPSYQWFRDNTKLEGETSNVLHVKQFSSKDEGKYYCYIYNDVSEVYTQRSHVMRDLPRQKAVAKIALIIANGEYDHQECLPTPRNDAAKMGNLLKEIGFKVIALFNLTTAQMRRAIKIFGEVLSEGVYGLFYFAGHGFKMQESHMLAMDAPKIYLRKDAISENELLAELLQNDPALLVVILDMCQTVPPKEFNPDIHTEVPLVNEYKSRKNLRNLVLAYSTSSYRPSYERSNSKYGLYMTHLSRYIGKDIPVTKMFEEVGKSVDSSLKGAARNQIPMFAVTITQPFRLTDATYKKNPPDSINRLNKLIAFPTKNVEVTFKQTETCITVRVSPYLEPYLNLVKLTVVDLQNGQIDFFNSVPMKRNNLYQTAQKREYWIHNPQTCEGPLVISLSRNEKPIGAALFHIKDHIPVLLKDIHMI